MSRLTHNRRKEEGRVSISNTSGMSGESLKRWEWKKSFLCLKLFCSVLSALCGFVLKIVFNFLFLILYSFEKAIKQERARERFTPLWNLWGGTAQPSDRPKTLTVLLWVPIKEECSAGITLSDPAKISACMWDGQFFGRLKRPDDTLSRNMCGCTVALQPF